MNIEELETRLSRRPGSPLFARLADEYLAVGRINEAKEICLSGLQRFPDYSTGHMVLARCFEAEQNYTSAVESVQEALRISPDASLPQSLLAEYKIRLLRKPTLTHEADDRDEISMVHFVSPTEVEVSEKTLSNDPPLAPDERVSDAPAGPDQADWAEATAENPVVDVAQPIEEGLSPTVTDPHDDAARRTDDPVDTDLQPMVESSGDVYTGSVPDATELDRFLYGSAVSESEVDGSQANPEAVDEATLDLGKTGSAGDLVDTEITVPAEGAGPPLSEISTDVIPERGPDETVSGHEEIGQEVGDDLNLSTLETRPPAAQGEPLPAPSTGGSGGRIVSKTLAEIYAKQGAYSEAILTYRMLQEERPEFKEEFERRIRELEPKVQSKPTS